LKKYIRIEATLSVDSGSHCETTTGRDNELFLIEKFISDRAAQRGRGDGKSRAFLTIPLVILFAWPILRKQFFHGQAWGKDLL